MLKERVNWLSRYAVLWVRVMFDLPVVEKTDHRAAIKIRKILLDQGFAMTRFSVHFRMVSGEDKRRALENKIRKIHQNLAPCKLCQSRTNITKI